VITIAMSTVVDATRDRVWHAIVDPGEVRSWDEPMLAPLDPATDRPEIGRQVRWRYRLGTVPVVLRDRPLEVVPQERLRSAIALGLFRFDQTYSLTREKGDAEKTRVTLKLIASNSVPVVGGFLDRFAVRRLASELVDARLRALQTWCETHP